MRALFIGGTGTISSAVVRRLAEDPLWEVWVLNRGNRKSGLPEGVHSIIADIHDEEAVNKAIKKAEDEICSTSGSRTFAAARAASNGILFDVVCEFIGFKREDVERDFRLFSGRTRQYIYTSSASAYKKPAEGFVITEGTGLANPYWQYSRDKIACEEFLMDKYRKEGFPVTIVRPSHTYCERSIPVGIHGANGSWQVIERMLEGKPVIIHGDGSSLWHLTFSTDFAVGYTALMGSRHAIGEAFQITGDEVLTWDQIYRTIADALGVKLHACHVASDFLAAAGKKYGYDFEGSLLGDKAVSVAFDNTKLKRLAPEMKTTVPFHKGVRIALDYLYSHPECRKADPAFDKWCDSVIAAQEKAKEEIFSEKGLQENL